MKRTFGLRAALMLLVLIAIAPVFVVVVQASLAEQRTRLERAEANLRSLVELGGVHHQRLVEGARQLLTAIAHAPPAYQDNLRACAAYLGQLQAAYPRDYGTFGMLDAEGRLTCRSSPPPAGVRSSDRPFFRAAVSSGRFSVGEYTISRASGRPVLTFGLPVYRESAAGLRGVAYLALDVDQLGMLLRKLAAAPEITLAVVDHDAVVLASAGPQPLRVGQVLPAGLLRDAVVQGRPRFERTRGQDGEQLFALQPVGSDGERRLYVAGLAHRADILAPGARRLYLQLAALALIALLAAAIAWLFADRVVLRPMHQLLGRVDALAQEQQRLDRPPPPAALREFDELNRRFHDMARRLAERAVQRDGALAEMEHQKNLLESVFESMAEGVVVMDRRGALVHLNAAAARILPGLGAARAADGRVVPVPAVGEGEMFLLDGVTPCHGQDRPSARALRGETVVDFRYIARGSLSGGEDKVIRCSARPMAIPGGGAGGAVLVFSDTTDAWGAERALQQTQEALRQLNDDLERRVADRTRELAIANQELESFSYSVSHDLRAPLQVIDGFGRALVTRHAERLDEQARHYLERIRDNTRQMGQLIDDLLALARVTRTELTTEAFDLAPRAQRVVDALRQRFPEREVEVCIDPRMPCTGDPRLLTVVLENLIGNAWKFTSRNRGARIRVGSRGEGPAVYYVEDNGSGFDMAYADKLFKAFQRLHAQSDFEGTGIGLATVHRIINRHGGRVWAESRPGEGATFLFTLQKGPSDEELAHPAG